MKQRLLLALLALFAAAGMVKADPSLKVTLPANSGNVKLMVTGTISTEQSAKIKAQGGSLSGNTITLPTTNGGKEYDLSPVPSITWSELTVEGIVSAFELKDIDAVTSLTFTKNGQLSSLTLEATGLKTLKCNNALNSTHKNLDLTSCTKLETVDCSNNSLESLTLTGLTNLKTLICSNNALTTITPPSITGSNKCIITCDGNQIKNVITSDATHFSVNYGYQYIEVTPSPNVIANQPVNIKDLASGSGLWGISDASTFKNNSDITCGSLWQKQDEDTKIWPSSNTSNTSEAKKNNASTYPNDYIFHNGNLYTKGTYRYSVEKKDNPIKFYVQIPVKAAQIPVKYKEANKINGVVAGSITIGGVPVTETSGVTLEAGTATDIKAVINTVGTDLTGKVEFDKYELSPGVSISNGKVTASGLVSAKEVSIQPIFKPKKFKITYTGPSSTVGGTYLVTANGSPINTGTQVDYGTTLAITTTINEGYEASVTKDGNTANILENGKATMTVTDNISLAISIIQKTSQTGFTVATNQTTLQTGASAMTIGGKTVKVDDGSISDKFTPGSTIQISITPQSNYAVKQITVANTPYTPTFKKDAGTYIADIVVPAMASAPIHIMFTELETITEVKAKPNVTYTYNGSPQTFQYVTTPAGLTMTKVEYSKDGSNWSTTAPTDVLYESDGTTVKPYKVRLTRNADANYAFYTISSLTMEIKPATATITTVPTVEVVNNNGVQSYSIKNGKANTAGVFHVTKAGSTSITDNKDIVPDVLKNKSHIVTVSFTAMNGDEKNKNYDCSKATVEIPVKGLNADALPTFQVSTVAASNLPEHITSLKIYNGNVELKSPSTVAKGTTLTFVATVEDGVTEAEIKETAAGATAINSTNKTPVNKKVSATQVVTNKMEITAIATAYTAPTPKSDFESVTAAAQTMKYTGSVLKYDPKTEGIKAKNKDGQDISNNDLTYTVSYKDANGKAIVLPVDAGIYTVSIKVSYTGYNDKTVTTTFEVQKATPTVTWPTATQIAKKQTLQQSTFIGSSANVPGTFEWKIPTTEPTNGSLHEVVFIPADTKNYEKVTTPADKKVKVTVSDKMLITYGNIVNGTLKIKDAEGYEYLSGAEISKGKVLTITATPNESFELETLTLNGNVITNGSTYTVKDESIALSATFILKKPDPAHVVITLPENGKGYKLSATGAKSVAFNATYTFTVSTLAADKDKIVVKAGGETIKANENGSYTVKGDKDKSIVVTLSNPTKIKVSVEQTTKNAKGFTMGKVEVEGLASDGTCYYNDVITLVAYPESGVTLAGWSDAASNTDKLRTLTVTAAMTIKPKFAGVPTGVETIESTRIYGLQGQIFIGYEGEATVTVVGMDGRMKKVDISGDTRIPMPAGIYGVILQKGTEAITTKVVVK